MKWMLAAIVSTLLLGSYVPQKNVTICGPKGSTRYHFNSKYRGLSNCKSGLYSVSLKEAQQLGLTLCKYEQ